MFFDADCNERAGPSNLALQDHWIRTRMPTAVGITAACSTVELPRNIDWSVWVHFGRRLSGLDSIPHADGRGRNNKQLSRTQASPLSQI